MNMRSNIRRALSVMIVVMMVASPFFVLQGSSSTNGGERALGSADIIIGNGQTFIIDENTIDPKTGQAGMYGQDGNITVQSGGTLIVSNARLYFIQDNGNDGDEGTSDDHHYQLRVEAGGTFFMDNGTITTVDWAVNPYLQFNVTIEGKGEFINNSTVQFPGTFTVNNGVFYANDTTFKGLPGKKMSDGISDKDANNDCPLMAFINSHVVFADSSVENYYSKR